MESGFLRQRQRQLPPFHKKHKDRHKRFTRFRRGRKGPAILRQMLHLKQPKKTSKNIAPSTAKKRVAATERSEVDG